MYTIKDAINAFIVSKISVRIYNCIKDKTYTFDELIGCPNEQITAWYEFNLHLYGDKFTLDDRNQSGWHIDHVFPISSFDLSHKRQQKLAFNWSNTRSIIAKKNRVKCSKILTHDIEQQNNRLNKFIKEKGEEFSINKDSLKYWRKNLKKFNIVLRDTSIAGTS